MKKFTEKYNELVNKAIEVVSNDDFQNVAAGSIGTLGIILQLKLAKKFYKEMIPLIQKDENKLLKAIHTLMVVFMTYAYSRNIGTIIGSCLPAKKLDDLETSEGFDDDLIQ